MKEQNSMILSAELSTGIIQDSESRGYIIMDVTLCSGEGGCVCVESDATKKIKYFPVLSKAKNCDT
jgi:hypothetical protein